MGRRREDRAVCSGRATTEGQWTRLQLARFRGRTTAARAPVGGVSGARIRTRQACARGEGLAGVHRPRGATVLRTVGRTDELTERKTLSVALSRDPQR